MGIARLSMMLFMLLFLLVVVSGGNYPHEPIAPKFTIPVNTTPRAGLAV